MLDNFAKFATVFVIYSVLGWILETAVCSIRVKRFVFRGFLLGPWCPIYGMAAVAILLAAAPLVGSLDTPNTTQWPAVFLTSLIIATLLEWIVSGIMGKLYGFQLWSYNNRSMNIQGRVALLPSILWGLLGVLLIYFVNIPVWRLTETLNDGGSWVGLTLLAIVMLDFISSVFRLNSFRKLTKAKNDVTEKYIIFVAEEIRNKWLPNIRKFIIKTFPNPDLLGLLGLLKKKKKSRKKQRKSPRV